MEPVTVCSPPPVLGAGMFENLGGDGSSMACRAKYNFIAGATNVDPDFTVEIYQKYNQVVTDSRELHGNLILEAKLEITDIVEMGFLFSPDPLKHKFDGLLIKSNAYSTASSWSVVYTATDLWMNTRPFADGKIDKL